MMPQTSIGRPTLAYSKIETAADILQRRLCNQMPARRSATGCRQALWQNQRHGINADENG